MTLRYFLDINLLSERTALGVRIDGFPLASRRLSGDVIDNSFIPS